MINFRARLFCPLYSLFPRTSPVRRVAHSASDGWQRSAVAHAAAVGALVAVVAGVAGVERRSPAMPVASDAEAWSVAQVGEWLVEIQLPQYCAAFEGNAIDGGRLLTRLTETKQLVSMGVQGHDDQVKLLAGVKELRIACGLEPRWRVPQALTDNEGLLTPAELELCRSLCLEAGQVHLFERWPAPGTEDEGKRALVDQLVALHQQYPGGLLQYHRNAVSLLADSKAGVNSFDGFIPAVPTGVNLGFNTEGFRAAENTGVSGVGDVGFVLVAGGLGERLGYGGIKVQLPTETSTGRCYLGLFCEHILALQSRARTRTGDDGLTLPLAIMTSDDTHAPTEALLERQGRFGMAPGQITLMKQNKVAALANNDGAFPLKDSDPYELETKPHGHGDVHVLLQQSGVLQQWVERGKKWLFFFQDTNAFAFRTFIAALGVSILQDYDFNTVTVPRQAQAAVGAICRLAKEDGSDATTLCVEYNQLDPLLRATVDPAGDTPDECGLSPYPGNTNQLVVKLSSYATAMATSGGTVPEFINPKYADAAVKDSFKSPTRLECMMQDFPKLLPPSAAVGFTTFPLFFYSPVKNNATDAAKKVAKGLAGACPATGEADLYSFARRLIGMETRLEAPSLLVDGTAQVAAPCVCAVADGGAVSYNDVPVELGPAVVLSPSFGVTSTEVAGKVRGGTISARSTLVLDGEDIIVEDLELDGALVVRAVAGACVRIKGLKVKNAGWEFVALGAEDDDTAPEELKIRGFKVLKHEERALEFTDPGTYEIIE